MPGYVLSLQADADLVGIYECTLDRWGVEQFHVYGKQLETALATIAADPLCRGSRARDDLLAGCRLFRVQHHYIAYRIGQDVVEIGRILHERMHFEQQVSDEGFSGFG